MSSSAPASASAAGWKPAKEYKFKLDAFQQEAVGYIEANESVLVAAHTSAGKTAVAEYAIAKSLRDKQRVIYTSPIKALSNQKYRDMQEEFGDVGLMTGDMTLNPGATCLIMTTEILRSMLYRGSEVMREVAWVIYDEVHYMRDKERGVVWEESIILLPHKVRFVFLSATIPNAKDFVSWVTKIHHQPCHVVYTEYRPVPLQHFVFPSASEGLYLVVDEKGAFREDNFHRAMGSLQGNSAEDDKHASKKARRSSGAKGVQADLYKIVRLIMERNLDPCIVFSFSKKECEAYAMQLARLDFNGDEEKELVERVFLSAMDALSEDDRQLPQVVTLLPLLKRGVGIHHGGLLPILKEVIEILFQEGLIKCLFATETFSIGINMPAKTVVFTATRKFDGKDFRWISSGEYIQMSGRAGRRGKDDRGIVIQMLDEKMEPDVAKAMIYGASDALMSSYHVSYNMVLNMMRVEDADPENLLKLSFLQYQQELAAPALESQAQELQARAADITIDISEEVALRDYYDLRKQLVRCEDEISTIIRQPSVCLPFLQAGRMLQLDFDRLAAAMAELAPPVQLSGSCSSSKGAEWAILLRARKGSELDFSQETSTSVVGKAFLTGDGCYALDVFFDMEIGVKVVPLDLLKSVSAIRLNLPLKDMKLESTIKSMWHAKKEVINRFKEGIPLLDPAKDMAVTSDAYATLAEREVDLNDAINKSAFSTAMNSGSKSKSSGREDMLMLYEDYKSRVLMLEQARLLRAQAKESQAVTMSADLRRMKKVLRKLDYISKEGVLNAKGRFSCELSTGDELVLTDMVFGGDFNGLSVEQAVALLSCFVHKEPSRDKEGQAAVQQDLQQAYQRLCSTARQVARVSIEAKIAVDEDEYVASFNPALMGVTYAWCKGQKFVDVCKLTDIFEGSIIRALRRLEELLRQLSSAAHAIGNSELKDMFEQGSGKIRRGVVFAASLYL